MEIAGLISFDAVLGVLFRTVVIFFFTFLVLRMLGKRHLAHLTYIDLLLVIALGSAVGDVMIYSESTTNIVSSMIAIAIVGVLVKFVNESSSRSKKIDSLVKGTAHLVIENGKILPQALDSEDMSEEDLMRLLREKEVRSIKNIRKAFIESDGEISLVLYNKKGK